MNEKSNKLSDLQEIVLWQQLNSQLIRLANQTGTPIDDSQHSYLRDFCLNNLLFSKGTGNPILHNIPMILFGDFGDTSFVSILEENWNTCLKELYPRGHLLNIEDALVEAFSILDEYDNEYKLTTDDGDENDEELELFIDSYLEERGKLRRDIPEILTRLYALKAQSLRSFSKRIDSEKLVKIEEKRLYLDLSSVDEEKAIMEKYHDLFCKPAAEIVEQARQSIDEISLFGMLYSERDKTQVKQSVKEFIDHEIELLKNESSLLDRFLGDINKMLNLVNPRFINLCDASPFGFLENPFPLV